MPSTLVPDMIPRAFHVPAGVAARGRPLRGPPRCALLGVEQVRPPLDRERARLGPFAVEDGVEGRTPADQRVPGELVQERQELQLARVQGPHRIEDGVAEEQRPAAARVGEVDADAATGETRVLRDRRHEARGGERESRHLPPREFRGQGFPVQPRSAEDPERQRGAPALGEVRPLQEAGAGVAECGMEVREVRRRRDPGQARLRPQHVASPALERHHRELQPQPELRHGEPGELADREAVARGDRQAAHEREQSRLDGHAFDRPAAERVRAVEDHEARSASVARRQGRDGARACHQGGEVGVVPEADILEVEHQGIEVREQCCPRLAPLAVQRDHLEPRDRVHRVADSLSGLRLAPEAVLRAEDAHEAPSRVAGRGAHDLHRTLQARIHRRRVGHQTDARRAACLPCQDPGVSREPLKSCESHAAS